MIYATDRQIRSIVRQMLVETRELQSTAASAQLALSQVALDRIAETVQESLTQREIARLEALNREATKHTARSLPPHAAAVEKLRSGDAEVVMVTSRSDEGRSPYLVMSVPPDPIPVMGNIRRRKLALVKSRSRQHVVRGDSDDVLYMFQTEDDMQRFLDGVVGRFGLRIGSLAVMGISMDDMGETTYGYKATLEKA